MEEGKRTYLGDGLYVYHDGFHVWLVANNGIEDYEKVALEPQVLKQFLKWLEDIKANQ